MKNKLLAFVLSAAMVLSLAACGSTKETTTPAEPSAAEEAEVAEEAPAAEEEVKEEEKEMVTVSFYLPSLATYTDDGIAKVEDAMNVILAEKYGIQVDLTYIEFGNFEKAMRLAMTTDEIDLTCFFTSAGAMTSYVNSGMLVDITDYFENASDALKNTFTEAEIASSSRGGRLYSLARKWVYGGHQVAVLNQALCEEMGIDSKAITTLDELEEVLYRVKEEHPEVYPIVPQSGAEMTWNRPFIKAGSTSFACTETNQDTELKSMFELDRFATWNDRMVKWYQDGLVMADALSNTVEGTDLVTAGRAFATFHNEDMVPLNTLYTGTVVTSILAEPDIAPNSVGVLQYGINTNSKYQDEAFTLLEAVYTDAELATLLCYGIEGENWEKNADGRAVLPEGVTSDNATYGGYNGLAVYPNYLLIPTKDTDDADNLESLIMEYTSKVRTPVLEGYYFDTQEYTDFLTAYTNIEDKYKFALMCGAIAMDDVLPTIQSELEAIGFYDVLAEMQKEVDAYIAK